MITVSNLSVVYSTKKLFENVNLKFTEGNCYGIIGANGAGKSTFLNILAKNDDSTTGEVIISKDKRISTLSQNQFIFDDYTIGDTVISGYKELFEVMKKKELIYQKEDFTEEDGIKSAELEEEFALLGGWDSEIEVIKLLDGLNLKIDNLNLKISELTNIEKVKVLLARALFGSPDILILDEPTNNLDFKAIKWLENFLINFDKTVIVVSHDRHFLNNICTHMVDIDYGQIKMFVGNYDFWKESSALSQKLMEDSNSKKEDKIKELKDFIAKFSANASKSKQATSRKKMLEKITLDDIVPSSRKYPYINIVPDKKIGKELVEVLDLAYKSNTIEFKNINFNIKGNEKTLFISRDDNLVTTLFQILSGENSKYIGDIKWGITVDKDYFPKDNSSYFEENNMNLVDWLSQYSKEKSDSYIRGFLGKLLFSKEEPLKSVKILSGGEKMRLMFARLMVRKKNTLIVDQPTNHLDLESIQSVNEGLEKYTGALIFSSHDLTFAESIAQKIIEITPNGCVSFSGNFNEFMDNEVIQQKIENLYNK